MILPIFFLILRNVEKQSQKQFLFLSNGKGAKIQSQVNSTYLPLILASTVPFASQEPMSGLHTIN